MIRKESTRLAAAESVTEQEAYRTKIEFYRTKKANSPSPNINMDTLTTLGQVQTVLNNIASHRGRQEQERLNFWYVADQIDMHTRSYDLVNEFHMVSAENVAILHEAPEFTTLKQQWQQKRGKSYKTSHGQEILPGFTGQIFT